MVNIRLAMIGKRQKLSFPAVAATVVGCERARMGQGFFEEFGPNEEIPDFLCEVGGQSIPWTPWSSRP